MLIPLKQPQSALRAAITAAYRRPEADAIIPLIDAAHLTAEQSIAARPGPLIGIQSVATGVRASNEDDYVLEQLLSESSVSLNTAAAGGNASLLMTT